MKLYSEDIEFLKELYHKDRVDLYFFHEKYRLSPAQLSRTLNKFLKMELVVLQGNEVLLNETGRMWIIKHRRDLFLGVRRKYWKEIPDNMVQNAININELYLPNKKSLDTELFKNFEDGK